MSKLEGCHESKICMKIYNINPLYQKRYNVNYINFNIKQEKSTLNKKQNIRTAEINKMGNGKHRKLHEAKS